MTVSHRPLDQENKSNADCNEQVVEAPRKERYKLLSDTNRTKQISQRSLSVFRFLGTNLGIALCLNQAASTLNRSASYPPIQYLTAASFEVVGGGGTQGGDGGGMRG